MCVCACVGRREMGVTEVGVRGLQKLGGGGGRGS